MNEPHDEHHGPDEAPRWAGPPTPPDEPTRELDPKRWAAPQGGWPPPWGYPPAGGWGYGPPGHGGGPAPSGPGGPSGPGVAPGPGGQWGWSPYGYPPARPARHTGLWIALLVAVVALASVTGVGVANWNSGSSNLSASNTIPSAGSTGSGGQSNTQSSPSVSAIAAKVTPALVDVNTVLGYARAEAAGTGVVLSSSGVILTNNHVIEGATQIHVTDLGNNKTYTASVIGYDRTDDIAVIQAKGASGLQTASLGSSSSLKVGQSVVGIGNAGGTGGTPSAAGGKVTALDQSVTASDESDGTTENLTGLIQTNADIQAGDSGGPLVDTSGKVIGIDTAGSAGFSMRTGQHQGFAIPVNKALGIGKQILASKPSGTVHIGPTAFLGVQVAGSAAACNRAAPAPGNSGNTGNGNTGNTGNSGNSGNSGSSSTAPSGGSGSAVCGVLARTPAASLGLAQGDTITNVGGHAIASPTALSSVLGSYHPGSNVSVTWTDASGQSHTANVTLATGPAA